MLHFQKPNQTLWMMNLKYFNYSKYTDLKLSVLKVNPQDMAEKPKAEASIGYKIYFIP
jgi:hypothetical protein